MNTANSPSTRPANYQSGLLSTITGAFVACLLLANVTSQKIFAIGPFTFPGGAVIIPANFMFGDILCEVYGYERSRRVIWTGFGCQILAAITYLIVGVLPPASFWHDQAAYDTVLGFVPRIVLASMTAYFCGEFCNSWVVSKMKYWAGGRRGVQQALRFVASTIVGDAIDSAIFMVVAFSGKLSVSEMLRTSLSLYLFKVIWEIIALPISMPLANWLKRVESVDRIDTPETTNYNPFVLTQ